MMLHNDVIVAIDWGGVGGAIHSLIALQKLSRAEERRVCLFISDKTAWISSLVEHLPWAEYYLTNQFGPGMLGLFRDDVLESITYDIGRGIFKLVNVSHHLPSPSKGWMVTDWWSHGFHCMDFSADCAGVEPLVGQERSLVIDDLPPSSIDHVVMIPNCTDPGQRGWPGEYWDTLAGRIKQIGGEVITIGGGDVVLRGSKDCRHYSLWEAICAMRRARIIISIDTMASASLAESVNTPIVRIHRGGRAAPSTGPGIQGWGGHVWCSDAGYNQAATVDTVMVGVEMLWDMKENWEANHIIK